MLFRSRVAFGNSESKGGSLNWKSKGMGGTYDWNSEGMGGFVEGTDKNVKAQMN